MGYWLKNWFSNMEPMEEPYEYEGVYYPTVEHFFQAMKFTDHKIRLGISEIPSPFGAKKRARFFADRIREDWHSIKEDVMREALEWKFQEGTVWNDILVSTGDTDIIEFNNWHDNEWGWCVCENCLNREHKNLLGKILMGIRKEHTG